MKPARLGASVRLRALVRARGTPTAPAGWHVRRAPLHQTRAQPIVIRPAFVHMLGATPLEPGLSSLNCAAVSTLKPVLSAPSFVPALELLLLHG